MVFIVIGIFIVILLIDLPQVKKLNGRIKPIIVYSVLISISFMLSVLYTLDKLPKSPAKIIEGIVRIFIK